MSIAHNVANRVRNDNNGVRAPRKETPGESMRLPQWPDHVGVQYKSHSAMQNTPGQSGTQHSHYIIPPRMGMDNIDTP